LPARRFACQKCVVMVRNIRWLCVGVVLLPLLSLGCSKNVAEPGGSDFRPAPAAPADPGPAKLEIVDDVVGKGPDAKAGDTVRVHYTGTLMNGDKFDSSRDRGTPFDFKLGSAAVIKGWDQGVVGMKVGGKRRLVIPQDLGYGEAGSPPKIPAKAGLKFEIELLELNPKTPTAAPASPDHDLGGEFEPPPDFDPEMESPEPESPQ
jgi:FKBP-type peptidyl-prolyl cis-trans isomerase FkpA